MKAYHFAAVIENDEEGYYALCTELQGWLNSLIVTEVTELGMVSPR